MGQIAGPVGWASLNGGTTGGLGGDTVTVNTRNAFVGAVSLGAPGVILVEDTIDLILYERIDVRSDKTILGKGYNATLRYGGLEIVGDNVIIQNLAITESYDGDWDGKTHSTDAITVYGENVWIDHCDLSASADGLLDITSDGPSQVADYVTVSWTRFSNHNKVMLIGSSDDNTEDRDHLRTTIHNCWFDGTIERGAHQRMPRVRYGDIHLFNNYSEEIASYSIGARLESDVVIENNYWRNAHDPHFRDDLGKGIKDPELVATGNIYELTFGQKHTAGDAFDPSAFYAYNPIPAAEVPAVVMNGAGLFNDPANLGPIARDDEIDFESDSPLMELDVIANDLDPDFKIRLASIVNEPEGTVLIKENIILYAKPVNPADPDTILYEIVDTDGGIDTGLVRINFPGTTSVERHDPAELTLTASPNPVSSETVLTFVSPAQGDVTFRVMDTFGRPVGQHRVVTPGGSRKTWQYVLNAQHLPPGIYFVHATQNEVVKTVRILVQ